MPRTPAELLAEEPEYKKLLHEKTALAHRLQRTEKSLNHYLDIGRRSSQIIGIILRDARVKKDYQRSDWIRNLLEQRGFNISFTKEGWVQLQFGFTWLKDIK